MMDQKSLRGVGERIITTFNAFAQPQASVDRAIGGRHIGLEAQRFQLWAHSLGLQRQGHASLDYRVRDSDIVRDRLLEVLLELEGHLGNLLSISNGERDPVEQGQASEGSISSSDSSSGSSYVAQDGDSDQDIFDEVAFRLKCLTERLDALYMIATRIRNPKNRPSRTNDQLYGNIAPADRESYRKEREEIETLTVSYLHRQDLLRTLESQDGTSLISDLEELVSQYASAQNWVMKRTGIANARRKQQFVYWKEHAAKLSGSQSQPHQTQQITPIPDSQPIPYERPHVPISGYAGPSLATSATPLPANAIKPDDMKSVISHQSGFSVPIDAENELQWPAPPKLKGDDNKIFGGWSMADPLRLYGTRQEWIDHEIQHLRVWHCRQHNEEFETQPDFLDHLKLSHPKSSPDQLSDQILSAAIAPSEHIHRGCPYCPSSFSDQLYMRKHIMNHQERFALLSFPSLDDEVDTTQDLDSSDESRYALIRGRAMSALRDFPGIREVACASVAFGNTRVDVDAAYYSMDDSILTLFIRSSSNDFNGHRIDYPFDIIRNLSPRSNGVHLLLSKPPLFKLLVGSRNHFIPCADFTNKEEASISQHTLQAKYGDLHYLRKQMQQLCRFADIDDLEGSSHLNLDGRLQEMNLVIPDNPIVPQAGQIQNMRTTKNKGERDVGSRDDEEEDDENLPHTWTSLSRYQIAHDIHSMAVDTSEPEYETPPIIASEPRFIRFDPDCAICYRPASVQCDCEARKLDLDVRWAEERIMKPIYDNIRSWVQSRSRNALAELLQSQEGITEPYSNLESPVTAGFNQDEARSRWDAICSQLTEKSEHFFSLVDASVPADDEPAVRNPPLDSFEHDPRSDYSHLQDDWSENYESEGGQSGSEQSESDRLSTDAQSPSVVRSEIELSEDERSEGDQPESSQPEGDMLPTDALPNQSPSKTKDS
ncbi:hypothetical protein PG987_012132 [Apiospora arundinis]